MLRASIKWDKESVWRYSKFR